MFAPTIYRPCGLLDAMIETATVQDPESSLYKGDRPWWLVKTAVDLARYPEWIREGVHVVVVCLEAQEEDPLLIEWRTAGPHVLWVRRSDVEQVPAGRVGLRTRFTLRDLSEKVTREG